VNELYKENCKPMKKEIEVDYRRWKDLPCIWIDRISMVKMPILLKAIHVFIAILIKIPIAFITESDNSLYLKVHLETQKTANSQGSTEQKEQCWKYHTT
jgi:hypothetical protein